MVRIMGSNVEGLMLACSMAPLPALMPNRMPPPSKAGPAEQEVHVSQSLFPTTISPFVPMSMKRVTSSRLEYPRPEHACHDVSSHIGCDGREKERKTWSATLMPSSFARTRGIEVGRGGIGAEHEILGIEPESEMGHDRVARKDHMGNLLQRRCRSS